MEKRIKIVELISADIRSRANVNIIRSAIDGINQDIVLDFTGVAFMSRSFTDELYNLMNEHKNLSLENMNDFIQSILDTVTAGRKSKRIFESESSEIKEFDDLKSLASFLSTI